MTTNFASLEPAFTARLYPSEGALSTGGSLSVVPFTSGSVVSEPGFSVPLDAEVIYGSDNVRMEPSQGHTRIHVNAILKNKDGSLLTYSYTGIIEVDEDVVALLTGSPNAKTTNYGKAVSHVTFQTGSETLKKLEHSLFIGTARFVVENGGYSVETKISRVIG
ncbi:hypothetical protein EDB81DRAFT_879407 [Dactylonectria macrodidyma]|uniref:Uncharacterized protein n=1 Tax=Dactylonectria macrodidyma TaxID=307937 RepID=A0A9P9FEX4_9HYPO|nr:hypothetical protein EDB81DRAFT_879407 [Dactylonectria macrodidyma]